MQDGGLRGHGQPPSPLETCPRWIVHLVSTPWPAVNERGESALPPRLPAAIVHALPLAQGPLRGLGDEVLS
jgi:hypothetical protein